MKIRITHRLQQFLNSKKDYPILAAFSVGYYSFVFYFSNNFDLVNSWTQFFYFLSYFILAPIVVFFILERIITNTKFSELLPQLFTVLMVPLFVFYLVGGYAIFVSLKRITLFVFIVFCIWKFKISIYKYFILLIFLMSIIPKPPIDVWVCIIFLLSLSGAFAAPKLRFQRNLYTSLSICLMLTSLKVIDCIKYIT